LKGLPVWSLFSGDNLAKWCALMPPHPTGEGMYSPSLASAGIQERRNATPSKSLPTEKDKIISTYKSALGRARDILHPVRKIPLSTSRYNLKTSP
jgi:hypothetical protein